MIGVLVVTNKSGDVTHNCFPFFSFSNLLGGSLDEEELGLHD